MPLDTWLLDFTDAFSTFVSIGVGGFWDSLSIFFT